MATFTVGDAKDFEVLSFLRMHDGACRIVAGSSPMALALPGNIIHNTSGICLSFGTRWRVEVDPWSANQFYQKYQDMPLTPGMLVRKSDRWFVCTSQLLFSMDDGSFETEDFWGPAASWRHWRIVHSEEDLVLFNANPNGD